MKFEMTHKSFPRTTELFTEENAPTWLTSENTVKGSTMDMRWFWAKHIMMLEIGQIVETDFRTIKRIE